MNAMNVILENLENKKRGGEFFMSRMLSFVVNPELMHGKISQKKEVRTMKKFLVLLFVSVIAAGTLWAGSSPQTTVLTVNPGVAYAIEISSGDAGASHDLGAPNLGGTGNAILIGTATNTGNVIADFKALSSNAAGPNSAIWTITNAAGVGENLYALQISTGQNLAPNNWIETNAKTEITNASTVKALTGRCLYARILVPTISGESGIYSLTVSLYAEATN